MSGNDLWVDTPHEPQPLPPVPKKRMSGCMIAAIIGGIFGTLGLLVCCGVLGWLVTMMMPTTTNVPAEITGIGKKVLDIELPPDFQPETAVTVDNMFMTMQLAKFKHKEGKGDLLLSSFKSKFNQPGQPAMPADQLRVKFEEEIRNSLDVKKIDTHDIVINGQTVNASIAEATDRATNQGVHTVTVDIPVPNGQSFIMLKLTDDVWDQDAVLRMLSGAKSEAAEEAKPEAVEEVKPEAAGEAKPEAVEEVKPEAVEEVKPNE